MLEEIGVKSAEELFADIPERIRFRGKLNLPPPRSEYEVRRHIEEILSRNKTSGELVSFLGAGVGLTSSQPFVMKSILAQSS